MESSDDAIIGKTLDGVITSWNAGAQRIFGYTAEETVGQPVTMLIPRELWHEEVEILRRLRTGQRVDHFETVRLRKDGTRIEISLTISPIRDANGAITGLSKVARDITDRKRAAEREEAVKAALLAEQKFRKLIENAPDAILQVDATGAIVIANRTAELLFGYTREELLALRVESLVPDAARAHHAAYREGFAEAGVSRPMGQGLQLHARRKDGTEIPVEISLSPMQTEAGALVTAVIRDVTERKRAEQQIQSLQQSYMTELESRQREAERLNKMKSEFMASMSHELRTPLHTIIGFAELLEEEAEGLLNERQKRFLDHIHKDSQHLLSLINDVLDLSRIEAGGMRLQTERVELRPAIEEAVAATRPQAEAKGVKLREPTIPEVSLRADPLRLRQILSNLLGNAVKFTPAGGRVSVSAARKGGLIEITVADTGIGIPEEERVRIFDKFYQAGYTTMGVREGTGLGLTICKQLVELQGGTIWVDSVEGSGSKFHFTLPVQGS